MKVVSAILSMAISTYRVSSDISHGRIKAAMDANLLEVAHTSETAHTSATCNHLNSIRTTILRILAYCCLNAIQKQHQGYTQTTTKGDNYHKVKLSPWEMHWQTLLHSLVYTAISFLRTLYKIIYMFISTYICATDEEHPSLNTSLDPDQLLELTSNMDEL